MGYTITEHTRQQAKALGVEVKLSNSKGKKIDVYKSGEKVASVGALGYDDYGTFLEKERAGKVPRGTAQAKRKAYKARHEKDRKIVHSPGWYADKLLW